jgi:outer membrane protein assembly factor BamE (lipoprotein component of BamABCDE complex)
LTYFANCLKDDFQEGIIMWRMAIILILCMIIGCASVGRPIDQAAADKIVKGQTTREQVGAMLGSPDRIAKLGNGDTMYYYSYARASAKPASFIPIFGPLVGGANVQSQMVMVTFGPDDIVKNCISSQGGTETGTGLATGTRAPMPEVEQGKRPQ